MSKIELLCGDCLTLMRDIADKSIDLVLTDPVWPNSCPLLPGSKSPYELFAQAAVFFPELTDRLIVHLGCTSDPRFLIGVPDELPYLRTCWLRYNFPSFRGRILVSSDVAYVFGKAPKWHKGYRLLPGECSTKDREMNIKTKRKGHPTPRKLNHLLWLIDKFSLRGDTILDPFMGSGTTAVACKELGRNFIGIEISPEYFEIAKKRIENTQEMML